MVFRRSTSHICKRTCSVLDLLNYCQKCPTAAEQDFTHTLFIFQPFTDSQVVRTHSVQRQP